METIITSDQHTNANGEINLKESIHYGIEWATKGTWDEQIKQFPICVVLWDRQEG